MLTLQEKKLAKKQMTKMTVRMQIQFLKWTMYPAILRLKKLLNILSAKPWIFAYSCCIGSLTKNVAFTKTVPENSARLLNAYLIYYYIYSMILCYPATIAIMCSLSYFMWLVFVLRMLRLFLICFGRKYKIAKFRHAAVGYMTSFLSRARFLRLR